MVPPPRADTHTLTLSGYTGCVLNADRHVRRIRRAEAKRTAAKAENPEKSTTGARKSVLHRCTPGAAERAQQSAQTGFTRRLVSGLHSYRPPLGSGGSEGEGPDSGMPSLRILCFSLSHVHTTPHGAGTRFFLTALELEMGSFDQPRGTRPLEEVAEAVGGGCCRLQTPLKLALGVRDTVAGHRLGLEGGGGGSPPFQFIPGAGLPVSPPCGSGFCGSGKLVSEVLESWSRPLAGLRPPSVHDPLPSL